MGKVKRHGCRRGTDVHQGDGSAHAACLLLRRGRGLDRSGDVRHRAGLVSRVAVVLVRAGDAGDLLAALQLGVGLQEVVPREQGRYERTVSGQEECQLDDGRWQYALLRSRGNTIEEGTSEIQRSIIASTIPFPRIIAGQLHLRAGNH